MRVGIRSGLVWGKICTALLLEAVLIATVLPTYNVAFSQTSTGTVAQAPLFTAMDLNPSGFDESHASGTAGGEQVGFGSGPTTGGQTHALMWRGSGASVLDLHPSGFIQSLATGTCGGQQVGYGSPVMYRGSWSPYDTHALMWRGSGASVVDLHPSGPVQLKGMGRAPITDSQVLATSRGQQVGLGREGATSGSHLVPLLWRGSAADVVELQAPSGFWSSYALGISAEEQVGFGNVSSTGPAHALLWRGPSATAVVDLNPRGFLSSQAVGTAGGQQVGYGSGPATRGQDHALLWRGSADVVDLHPSGFFFSRALATSGAEQVGWGDQHALLWRGSAASVVDLHTFLPPGFMISVALDVDATGDIVGTAWGPASGNRYHAFLWKQNAPKPAASGGQNNSRCQNQS